MKKGLVLLTALFAVVAVAMFAFAPQPAAASNTIFDNPSTDGVFQYCFVDQQFSVTLLEFDVNGTVIKGQANADGFAGFPAALNGAIHSGRAHFSIGYVGDSGERFYDVNFQGVGSTYGTFSTTPFDYYDPPAPDAVLVPCAQAPASNGMTGAPG